MLDAAIVPPGSMQVFFLPGGVFAHPSQQPGCTPLIDQARYWMVPGDPQGIASFLRAHAPPGIPNKSAGWSGTGGGQTIPYDVLDAERGNSGGSPANLDFTVAALGAGMAGIRADAEVVADFAACSYSGGPGPAPARPPDKRDPQRHSPVGPRVCGCALNPAGTGQPGDRSAAVVLLLRVRGQRITQTSLCYPGDCRTTFTFGP
jgi:hypothetical protein